MLVLVRIHRYLEYSEEKQIHCSSVQFASEQTRVKHQLTGEMTLNTTSFRPLWLSLVMMAVTMVTPTPIIQAPWGTIKGVEVEGDGGRKMDGYLGIPFALPPVGDLRFEKPVPHPGLGEGEAFVADVIMPACIQMKGLITAESRECSEDCLKLNVFVPKKGGAESTSPTYPVMFFIHGGGLISGDATTYRPSRLVADGEVIVVVIQYRLGPFGFISTGDKTLPGNQGFWDQNLALRWVKDNIRAFGGDPDLITVFGESSGSMSTGIHMMSPHSSKLIKRVIMQSGSPERFDKYGFKVDASAIFRRVTELFQCHGDTTRELLQCLKEQEAEDFFNRILSFGKNASIFQPFNPRVDGDFIPRLMKELVHDERYMHDNGIVDIDVMSGFTNQEGSLAIIFQHMNHQPIDTLRTSSTFRLYLDQCTGWVHAQAKEIVKKAVEFFYRGKDSFTNRTMSGQEVVDMFGDCTFIAPAVNWARQLATMAHTSNHYLYALEHDFHFNKQGLIHGAHHTDDLLLEFDYTMDVVGSSSFFNKPPLAEDELPLADKFVEIVTAFAKTGNPSPPVRDDLGGDWPQFTTDNNACLSVSRTPRVQKDLGPYNDRTAVWTKLVPELEALVMQDSTAQTREDEVPQTRKDEL